jgi:hypothetical protein
MEQTLQDRIRERAYHVWNDWCGQGDDNHYRLKERAVGICRRLLVVRPPTAGGIATGDRPWLHLAG